MAHNVPLSYNKDANSRALLATRLMAKYDVAIMELPRFLTSKQPALKPKKCGSIILAFHPTINTADFLQKGVYIHGQVRRTSEYISPTTTPIPKRQDVTPDTFRVLQQDILARKLSTADIKGKGNPLPTLHSLTIQGNNTPAPDSILLEDGRSLEC